MTDTTSTSTPIDPEPSRTAIDTTPTPVVGIYGWICPLCGRGNAPFTSTCPCIPPPPIVWTC